MSELDDYDVKTLLDVGCGRGGFLKRALAKGMEAKGCDLSSIMVQSCKKENLDVILGDISKVNGKFDAIVSIFDVLNFMNEEELQQFLNDVFDRLNDDGIFIADINTKHGFSNVADGVMSNEDENFFLNVEAIFKNNILETIFTLFEKENECYKKYQDKIIQYFHPIKTFQKNKKLKLIDKQTFSLYDTNDKTLLILKKK
jgi:cyclopropane fatty-acyl-phospholipid synthase-like methyltransferase